MYRTLQAFLFFVYEHNGSRSPNHLYSLFDYLLMLRISTITHTHIECPRIFLVYRSIVVCEIINFNY